MKGFTVYCWEKRVGPLNTYTFKYPSSFIAQNVTCNNKVIKMSVRTGAGIERKKNAHRFLGADLGFPHMWRWWFEDVGIYFYINYFCYLPKETGMKCNPPDLTASSSWVPSRMLALTSCGFLANGLNSTCFSGLLWEFDLMKLKCLVRCSSSIKCSYYSAAEAQDWQRFENAFLNRAF